MKVRYKPGILEKYEWQCSSINIDNFQESAYFVFEKGIRVEVVSITMQEAINNGIINIDNLTPFLTAKLNQPSPVK